METKERLRQMWRSEKEPKIFSKQALVFLNTIHTHIVMSVMEKKTALLSEETLKHTSF